MRRRCVERAPVLPGVLTVVALGGGEPQEPVPEARVPAVPERECETEPLAFVAYAEEPVLTPAVDPGSGVVVWEVRPRVAARAVVLTDRAPLPRADVGAPTPPKG